MNESFKGRFCSSFLFLGHTSRISRVIATGEFIFSTSYDRTFRAWTFDADTKFDPDDPDIDAKACLRTFQVNRRIFVIKC